jgi:hypothetical protein
MSWKKKGKCLKKEEKQKGKKWWKSCNNRGKQRNKKWKKIKFEVTTKMKERKSIAQTKQKKK